MNRLTEADRQLAEVRRRLTTAGIAVLAIFAVLPAEPTKAATPELVQ